MKIIDRYSTSTVLSLVLFHVFLGAAFAQTAADEVVSQPLFETHDLMTVRIEAPLTTLVKDRPDKEYLDGTLSYLDSAGIEHTLDLKLRTRGITRRKKTICNFPPIRLNFRKKQVEGTEFGGQDKLKLVTHCQSRKSSFEQLVLREYLAYRILQLLTDKSFSARLMRITYVDTESKDEPSVKYGFVIEDIDNLGNRIGMKDAKLSGIRADELDRQHANLISVYQYLIGNTDFSLILGPADKSCCHNSVLFSSGGAPYTAIPYDFDYSGIVDAPYAVPNPRFKSRSVKQRFYRGRCMNNDLLDGTFAYFREKEAEIRELVDGLDGLTNNSKKDIQNYLSRFFKDISDPKMKDRRFISQCS